MLTSENKKCKLILEQTGQYKYLGVSSKYSTKSKRGKKLSNIFHKVAFKIGYIGGQYLGFAAQDHTSMTVENFIFQAFNHFNLIKSTKEEIDYSRCGRTDKGVSAAGQVIALNVRSNCDSKDKKEFPYVLMLNMILPKDIRVLGAQKVDKLFSARFDCRRREYKYFFPRMKLNIDKMKEATKNFLGTHDFRNFCQIDVCTTTNFVRTIESITIEHLDQVIPLFKGHSYEKNHQINLKCSDDPSLDIFVVSVYGSAFLQHQIRFMMEILFLIGNGKEDASVITELLNIKKYPGRPSYGCASEFPLILYSCFYPNLKFENTNPKAEFRLVKEFRSQILKRLTEISFYSCFSSFLTRDCSYKELQKRTEELDEEYKRNNKNKFKSILDLPKSFTLEQKIKQLHGKRKQRYLEKQEIINKGRKIAKML